jgi:hypothetical protein
MDLLVELRSKSAPRIKKAAARIAKQKLAGFEDQLIEALKLMMDKPRSWATQSPLIGAIGVTGFTTAVPYLKELATMDFDATVLYRDLGFAICLLDDIPAKKLDYLFSTLKSGNMLLIAGACSSLLYAKYIPTDREIEGILEAISPYVENEGKVITPRCYIAALAYLWPTEIVKPFLEQCMRSNWDTLVEIAQSSVKGEQSKYVLVYWV